MYLEILFVDMYLASKYCLWIMHFTLDALWGKIIYLSEEIYSIIC